MKRKRPKPTKTTSRRPQPFRKTRSKQKPGAQIPSPHKETSVTPLSLPEKPFNPEEPWRLNRILSSAGLTSRRKADQWITSGRIMVNGKPVKSTWHNSILGAGRHSCRRTENSITPSKTLSDAEQAFRHHLLPE